MRTQHLIGLAFILIALLLGTIFYQQLNLPQAPWQYFEKSYYNQLGPLAIAVELLVAGIHLFLKHSKANFTLALFGFTALLDPIFNLTGLFDTNVPLYGSVLFILCAVPALWIAFTDSFGLGKIRLWSAVSSFILGVLVELFFNYYS